jgi:iodotyrosine deiodinase
MSTSAPHIALTGYTRLTDAEMTARAISFYQMLASRRTVRDFSDTPVPREVIERAILTAGRAPSGANQQPWHFAVIASPDAKRKVRIAAEEEERAFYGGRATQEWLNALAPLGTDAQKPFLEIAPYLIVCFGQRYGHDETGERVKHYYVPESVGIAMGFLIASLHHAGLATLTHTPSPMKFLNEICERPEHEQPYVLLVVGHPAAQAKVPDITKKSLAEISSWR